MNKPITHDQAIQFLHEAARHLSVDQRSDLAAHLAECDQCRSYADQLDVLQPALTRALHTRRYVHGAESGEISHAILHHKRRQFMRKRIMVATSIVIVTAFAIVATAVSRMPSQSWTGAPLTPTATATFAPTPTPTLVSPLPTPTLANAFTSIIATPAMSFTAGNSTSFKLPWTTGVTHCVTQNHRVQRNGWGLDFDLNRETILAPQDGIVTFAGWNSDGGGNTIIISHTNRFTSTYMHLGLMAVKVGDLVRRGQPIGASGSTGQATGPLLHFQLEDNGSFVDPVFAEVGRVLKDGDCATSQNTPFATGPDRFEPNNDFDQAQPIELNVTYDNLNFAQWDSNSSDWDNDFFKVRVKSGMIVTCRTLDLASITDTNLILYDENRNGLNGNDDVNRAAGDKSSSVTYTASYDGWLYVLVGEGFSRSPVDAQQATYSLECATNQ